MTGTKVKYRYFSFFFLTGILLAADTMMMMMMIDGEWHVTRLILWFMVRATVASHFSMRFFFLLSNKKRHFERMWYFLDLLQMQLKPLRPPTISPNRATNQSRCPLCECRLRTWDQGPCLSSIIKNHLLQSNWKLNKGCLTYEVLLSVRRGLLVTDVIILQHSDP